MWILVQSSSFLFFFLLILNFVLYLFHSQEFFLKHAFSQYATAKVDSTYLEPSDGSPSALSYTCEDSSQTEWTTIWMDKDNPEWREFCGKSQIACQISEGYLFNKSLLIIFIILPLTVLSPFFILSFPCIFLSRFHDIEWKYVLRSGRITIIKSRRSQVFSKAVESTVCPITAVWKFKLRGYRMV